MMAVGRIRPSAYSGSQKLLHWVIALIVLIQIPIGFYMKQRGLETKFDAITNELYTAHKTFGFILLLLVLVRIFVRVRTGAPAPEASLSRLQVVASEAVHGLLYGMLLLVPLLGWTGVSAYGARGILGGFNLPEILAQNAARGEMILQYHRYAAILITLLIGMHVGAALFHRLILKDGVLKRMLP